jgi:mediator of RNA polymerase II transcription subunit 31
MSEASSKWTSELEFVNALASPDYLVHLAHHKYFDDPDFLRYLEYLLDCWTDPAYAKFVVYPHALCFLELLQEPEFRKAICQTQFKEAVHQQQYYSWAYARANRLRETNEQQQQQLEQR